MSRPVLSVQFPKWGSGQWTLCFPYSMILLTVLSPVDRWLSQQFVNIWNWKHLAQIILHISCKDDKETIMWGNFSVPMSAFCYFRMCRLFPVQTLIFKSTKTSCASVVINSLTSKWRRGGTLLIAFSCTVHSSHAPVVQFQYLELLPAPGKDAFMLFYNFPCEKFPQ